MKFKHFIPLALLFASASAWSQSGRKVLNSPDRRLAITFQTVADNQSAAAGGKLVYAVTFNGKSLIDDSALQLDLEGQPRLGAQVQIVKTTPSQTNETYRLVAGKASLVRDHYDALRIELEEKGEPNRKLVIEARAYNDAVAFRYLVPEQAGLSDFRLTRESTEFRISKDPFIHALVLPNYRSMYESEFIKLSASSLANQGGVKSTVLVGLPLLMEVPGVAWLAISEADLQNYAAMYLVNPSGSWAGHWFESRLAPQVNNTNLCVTGSLPHHSAWRVIMVGTEPGRLVESDVITSLNPPSAIQDTSWIHPGKAAWDWWSGSIGSDGRSAFTTANMKYYVDFAAQSGFAYMLVDAGWSAGGNTLRMNGRVDIPELVSYAAPKGVKVWIWVSYDSLDRQMEDAFSLYEKWGVAGVKTDFIERNDQRGINFYYRAAETAARHHLMVDFHGSTTPTGLERQWPNVLGYEAVCGMEQSKAGSRDNPDHRVMLPFTRMLAGPMDYTPGGFRNVTREAFEPRGNLPLVMGTRAQQLAMYVVYQAAFQMVSDCPSAYAGAPEFQFIKDVPTTWDETRVLDGLPGDFVTIARRRGQDWFVGSMSNWKPRSLDIPLPFLGSGDYTAEIYADAPDAAQFPQHVVIEKKRVTATTHLTANLAPGGGYAVRIHAEE